MDENNPNKIPEQPKAQEVKPQNPEPENQAYLTKLPEKYRKDFDIGRGTQHRPLDKYPFKSNPEKKQQEAEYMNNFNKELTKARAAYDSDEENKRVAKLFDLDPDALSEEEYDRHYLARRYGTTPEALQKLGFEGNDYYGDLDDFLSAANRAENKYGYSYPDLVYMGFKGGNSDDVDEFMEAYYGNSGPDYDYHEGRY